MVDRLACEGCHKRVAWATTNHGRRVLMNDESDDAGDWVVVDHVGDVAIVARLLLHVPGEARYSVHSCRAGS